MGGSGAVRGPSRNLLLWVQGSRLGRQVCMTEVAETRWQP
ncbi:MAG: hypothetical protein GIKADHBN_00169 [Phycisphaerales bacterium]|nr:hypothetical protein [Phycisphaerales bacterium]